MAHVRGRWLQTLRNLSLPRQREYYAQTVSYIIPLAEARDWWGVWYAAWRKELRERTWEALSEVARQTGQAVYAVLRFRVKG